MLISGLYPDLERGGEASIVLNSYEAKKKYIFIYAYIALQNTQTQIFIDLIAEEDMTKTIYNSLYSIF